MGLAPSTLKKEKEKEVPKQYMYPFPSSHSLCSIICSLPKALFQISEFLPKYPNSFPILLLKPNELSTFSAELSTFDTRWFLRKRSISRSLIGNTGTITYPPCIRTLGSRLALWDGNGKWYTVAETFLGPWSDPLTSVAYSGKAKKSRQATEHSLFSCSLSLLHRKWDPASPRPPELATGTRSLGLYLSRVPKYSNGKKLTHLQSAIVDEYKVAFDSFSKCFQYKEWSSL